MMDFFTLFALVMQEASKVTEYITPGTMLWALVTMGGVIASMAGYIVTMHNKFNNKSIEVVHAMATALATFTAKQDEFQRDMTEVRRTVEGNASKLDTVATLISKPT